MLATRSHLRKLPLVRKLWITFIIVGACLLLRQQCTPIHHQPGILARSEPQQTNFGTPQPSVTKDGWSLKPLATFSLEARVLSVTHYTDDFTAPLSPTDLALGWGRMSDSSVLDKIDVTQGNRFYRWRYWGDAPIPEQEIKDHSANMHIIPADDAVAGKLRALRKGAVVRLAGSLVEATHPKGDKPWTSSLTRDDTGEGACEIILVKSLIVR